MSRIVGVRDLYVAKLKTDNSEGATWDTPIRVPSLVSLSISDTVEQSKFYSDDTVEQSFSKTSSKEVTIELGYLTTDLESIITGKEYEEGILLQGGDDAPPEIAIMFRSPKSKGGFRYSCLYKGSLARTESEYATQEDTIESSTVTLTGTFISLAFNNKMGATADTDTVFTDDANGTKAQALKAKIDNWFTAVPLNAQG